MKKFTATVILGLIALIGNAQKVIEKNIDHQNQFIDIELKFASDIKIKTWDNPSIYIKADITMEEKNYEALFELDIDKGGEKIKIGDNSESIFKKIWDDREKESGKKQRYFSIDDEYTFNYVLYIPKNATFKISSINGNMTSEIIEGNFTVDFINGSINIAKYAGNLDINTINGEIDLKILDTSVSAETIHGNIYADEKLKFTAENRMVGQKVEGKMGGAKNSLKLNTINGNMYLRVK